jgi:hypothetical protein
MPEQPDKKTFTRIEEGRLLFNARRYFEAHEVWEEAWLVEKGPARRMLQGLIQIAAGLLKASLGAPRPCVLLLEAGLEKLSAAAAADPVLGAFADSVRSRLAQARRWERGEVAGLTELPDLPPFGAERA